MKKSKGPIKSAKRALRMFEIFDDQQRPLSVSEIAEYMNIPQSSATELTKSLTDLGYLSRDENSRGYQPTLRIAVLGRWLENTLVNRGSVVEMMSEIQAATGETVILGFEQGTEILYAHVESSQSELQVRPFVGAKKDICQATAGIMMLTLKSDDVISRIVRWRNAEKQNLPELNPEEVLKKVKKARRQGFFLAEGTVRKGVGTIAVLLPRKEGQKPAVLAVGAPLHRFSTNKKFIRKVVEERLSKYFQ